MKNTIRQDIHRRTRIRLLHAVSPIIDAIGERLKRESSQRFADILRNIQQLQRRNK